MFGLLSGEDESRGGIKVDRGWFNIAIGSKDGGDTLNANSKKEKWREKN